MTRRFVAAMTAIALTLGMGSPSPQPSPAPPPPPLRGRIEVGGEGVWTLRPMPDTAGLEERLAEDAEKPAGYRVQVTEEAVRHIQRHTQPTHYNSRFATDRIQGKPILDFAREAVEDRLNGPDFRGGTIRLRLDTGERIGLLPLHRITAADLDARRIFRHAAEAGTPGEREVNLIQGSPKPTRGLRIVAGDIRTELLLQAAGLPRPERPVLWELARIFFPSTQDARIRGPAELEKGLRALRPELNRRYGKLVEAYGRQDFVRNREVVYGFRTVYPAFPYSATPSEGPRERNRERSELFDKTHAFLVERIPEGARSAIPGQEAAAYSPQAVIPIRREYPLSAAGLEERTPGAGTAFRSPVTATETEPIRTRGWVAQTMDLPVARAAVISPEAASRHAGLEELAGQARRIGDSAWVVVLPREAEQVSEALEPLLLETRPVKIHEFSGLEEDPALDAFRIVIQPFVDSGSFRIVGRQPLVGADFQTVLRQLLAALAGLEEGAISEEWVREVEGALGLGVQL